MRRLVPVCVALAALLAFGAAAGGVDDLGRSPALQGPGAPATPTPPALDATPGPGHQSPHATPTPVNGSIGCTLFCDGFSIRSLLAGLLPGLPGPALVVIVGLGLTLLAYRRAGTGRTDVTVAEAERGLQTDDARDAVEQGEPAVTDAPADNEVYRAWRTMVERLDHDGLDAVGPDADESDAEGECDRATTTPGEYARRAREHWPAAPVDRLTEQFRAVRYGRATATEEREHDARDALEALE